MVELCSLSYSGSPKKHETLGRLTDILIRMKDPSFKTNMQKICVLLSEFYQIL